MKLINFVVAAALLVELLENRDPIMAVVGLMLVIVWSLCLRLSKGLGFRRLEWAIVICLSYWLLSYSWSTADFHNLISYDFLRRDGALLVSYTGFLGLLGWPLKPGEFRRFWITFLFLLALIAVPGLFYCLHLFPYPEYIERLGVVAYESFGAREVRGWFETHNTAGGVFGLGSILSLALARELKVSPKFRHFLWGLFLCCLGALVFTWSRGSYLGFLVGTALIVPLRKLGTSIRIGLLIGVPVLLLGLMTSTVFSRIDSITDPYYGTNAERLQIWGDALDDFSSSPIVGIGFGRWNDEAVVFKGVKGLVWVGVHGRIFNGDNHAHNSYLQFLAEGGIIGLWLTLRVWWCAWAELSFFESKLAKSQLRTFNKAAKACLLGLMMMSVTEHMMGKGSVALVAMSLIGMTLAASRMEWRAMQEAQKYDLSAAHALTQTARARRSAALAR